MNYPLVRRSTGLIISWLILLSSQTFLVSAQVYTQQVRSGGTLNRLGTLGATASIPALDLPAVDITPLLADDARRAQKGLPLRVGVTLPAPVDIMQAASQADRAGLRVYLYRINVPGAVATSLVFDQLELTPGTQLFIYTADRTVRFGPITATQNGTGFPTDFLSGASVIVEVQEPTGSVGQNTVRLGGAVHAYRDVTGAAKSFGIAGGSGACEVNLVCQPTYQPDGDGVALILASYGGYTYICTGSMINSTRQDFRSYFLTAFHCVDFNGDGTLGSGEVETYTTAQFRFNWQSPTCTPTQEDPVYVTLSGGALKAARRQSDFSLFELGTQPPQTENLTYLGWNRGSENATDVVSIHHPLGDVKKITFGGPTTISGYGVTGTDHLTASWTTGATEGGSSGSPLLDQNRRIIGQLHGGPSYCGAPPASLKDYYGRFYTSWDEGGIPGTQLSDILDPGKLGSLTTDGAKASLSGPDSFTGSASFALNTGAGTAVTWAVSNGASAVTTTNGSGNTVLLTASSLALDTPVTLVFTVNAGQPYLIQFSRTVLVTAGATGPLSFAFLPPVYDCTTGAITFRTTGGNGSTVEYRAVGVTDWTTNPNQTVDAPVRGDGQALTLMARQQGAVIETPFDFRAYCADPTPPVSVTQPTSPTALGLLPPTYDCATGAITFRTSGGDGSTVEYRAVGVTDWTTNPNQTVDAPVRGDGESLTLMARQRGVVVQSPFDFRAYCRSSVRLGATETTLDVRVLGNPGQTSLRAEARGATGQWLRWQLIDTNGRSVGEHLTSVVQPVDQQEFDLKNQPPGLLLLRVSTASQAQTVRILIP